MNYPLFIARKIYNGGDKTRKVSKPAITIATIGCSYRFGCNDCVCMCCIGF